MAAAYGVKGCPSNRRTWTHMDAHTHTLPREGQGDPATLKLQAHLAGSPPACDR